jgi:hypothetical protein
MQSHEPTLRAKRDLSVSGCLRALALVGGMVAFASVWSLRAALADADVAVQRTMDALVAELGPQLIGTPEELSINGQTLKVAVHSSELDVSAALDRFALHCAGRAEAPLPLGPARGVVAKPELDETSVERLLARLSVLRRETKEEGRLLCFAREDGHGLRTALAALRGSAEHADLSALGKLRYVSARRQQDERTQLIVVWAEQPLRIAALLPERGDAPGSDMHDVPRPPVSTRDLSVSARGRDYALRLYRTRKSRAELLVFYDHELAQRGFQKVPVLPSGGDDLGQGLAARAFVREGRALAIGIQESAETGEAQVSLIDLGGSARMVGAARASLWPQSRAAKE